MRKIDQIAFEKACETKKLFIATLVYSYQKHFRSRIVGSHEEGYQWALEQIQMKNNEMKDLLTKIGEFPQNKQENYYHITSFCDLIIQEIGSDGIFEWGISNETKKSLNERS